MLKLTDITKNYAVGDTLVPALRGVSLSFRESEFVSILGPSGCGKTTLLNIIGGLDHYTSGDLVIRGTSTKEYGDADWDAYRNHSVGFVFQSYNLIPHQSVLANVELALTLSGVPKSERRRRAVRSLERVGLADQIHKRPNQLSGGQMQRVAIARALVNDPDILLADEPTGALDTETSVAVLDLLREVAKEKLVVMVTHNADLADTYSTRIIRLLDGQVTGDSNPYTADFPAPAESAPAESAPAESVLAESPAESATPEADMAEPAAESVPESATAEKTGKRHKEKKRTRSMSPRTALTLSLNNLMTKKGRTFLTSFAGSIGIIGIALILALSNGINLYIAKIQEDTLTAYPISIYREEPDVTSMISSLMGASEGSAHAEGEDKVYSSAVFYNLLNAMLATDVSRNNLSSFREYLESGVLDGLDATLQYGYDIPLTIYSEREDGNYTKSDIMELLNSVSAQMGGGSSPSEDSALSGSFSSFSVWQEVIAGNDGSYVSDMIKGQYNLISGAWPTDKGDILLVINDRNEVNDMTLYALGLKSEEEMMSLLIGALGGQKIDTDLEVESWNYDEIVGRTFRLVLPANGYADIDNDGDYEDISDNETLMKPIIRNGLSLRVSGIIRPDPDAVSSASNGSLLYTKALTDYMLSETLHCAAVIAQKENPGTDIFTGLPFEVDPSLLPQTDEERAAAFRAHVQALSDAADFAGLSELYRSILTTPTDAYIEGALAPYLATFTDRDDIIEWVTGQYGSSSIAEVLGTYLADFTLEELRAMLTSLLSANLKTAYAEAGESAYRTLRETPSAYELRQIIQNEILPDYTSRAAKEAYITAVYTAETAMSEETVSAWLATLDDTALTEAMAEAAETEARTVYAARISTVSESTKNNKSGAAMLTLAGTLDDGTAATYYTMFVPDGSAGTSYDENLTTLGALDAGNPDSISIYVSSFSDKDKVAALIDEYNGTVEEEDEITYTDYVAMIMSSVTFILDAVTYALVAFVSVSLVVSSIMIGIITYISVLERTKEIGILRAIGASKHDVSRVFNAETLIIGFAAGMIGILITLLLCLPINLILHHLTGISDFGASLPVGGAVALVLISMFLTLVAGLLPALLAARKDPVVALRSE